MEITKQNIYSEHWKCRSVFDQFGYERLDNTRKENTYLRILTKSIIYQKSCLFKEKISHRYSAAVRSKLKVSALPLKCFNQFWVSGKKWVFCLTIDGKRKRKKSNKFLFKKMSFRFFVKRTRKKKSQRSHIIKHETFFSLLPSFVRWIREFMRNISFETL